MISHTNPKWTNPSTRLIVGDVAVRTIITDLGLKWYFSWMRCCGDGGRKLVHTRVGLLVFLWRIVMLSFMLWIDFISFSLRRASFFATIKNYMEDTPLNPHSCCCPHEAFFLCMYFTKDVHFIFAMILCLSILFRCCICTIDYNIQNNISTTT